MASSTAIDDVRLSAGLYDIREAARLIDLPEQTFHRWARGYEHSGPLLHMTDRDALFRPPSDKIIPTLRSCSSPLALSSDFFV
ncbi:MAG: helix-turn-helix domain-containing protein [Pseudonocardiaceae bacterium]